jgi:uncharacterized protein with NRDE domain
VNVCTIVIAWQVFPDTPVAVAANRDELLDRPAEPPAAIEDDPRIVAPRDAEAGGTWIGYNEHGVLVALTNRWIGEREGDRSRGLLVREALRRPTAEDAVRFVERNLDEYDYEGFNLLAADAEAAVLVEYDGLPTIRTLEPGVHVVTNVGIDGSFFEPPARPEAGARQAENARAVRDALQPEPAETATAWLDRAAAVIADHEYGVCVHGPDPDPDDPEAPDAAFGTRSSSLIAIGETGAIYRFADGPPCRTDYHDVTRHDGSA